ncbi:hypothetical protein [Caulobacter sp. LjRoot300]|uniref:hypothetical protein n=1 Tax=Caulobacter sp. LjRoot300 TaxID=3342321 RepID=UPI003ECC27B0
MKTHLLILSLAGVIAGPACGQNAPAPAPPIRQPADTPALPAFKTGMTVIDRAGAAVGKIAGLAEDQREPIVIVEIDGKMVGLLQRTLALENDHARSTQTKAQMLTTAQAPR